MGCFIGCFRGRKDRKALPHSKNTRREPSSACAVPVRLGSSAAPLASRREPVKGSSREHLPSGSSGTAALRKKGPPKFDDSPLRSQIRCTESVIFSGSGALVKKGSPKFDESPSLVSAADSTPEKQNLPACELSTNPWSQVDDLEKELEDLRRTLVQESKDAKKLRDEVKFLKSCGTLVKTPIEIKKSNKIIDSSTSPEKDWHSWLHPSISSVKKIHLEKDVEDNAPTLTKECQEECHEVLQECSTPVSLETYAGRPNTAMQSASQSISGGVNQFPLSRDKTRIMQWENRDSVTNPKEFECESVHQATGFEPDLQHKSLPSFYGDPHQDSTSNDTLSGHEYFEISLSPNSYSLTSKEVEIRESMEEHKVMEGKSNIDLLEHKPCRSSTQGDLSTKPASLSGKTCVDESEVTGATATVNTNATDTKKRARFGLEIYDQKSGSLNSMTLAGEDNVRIDSSTTQKRQKILPAAAIKGKCEDGSETCNIASKSEQKPPPILDSGFSSMIGMNQLGDNGAESKQKCTNMPDKLKEASKIECGHVENFHSWIEENYTTESVSSDSRSNATPDSAIETQSASTPSGKASGGSYTNSSSFEGSTESVSEDAGSPSCSYEGSEDCGDGITPVRCSSPPFSPAQKRHSAVIEREINSSAESSSSAVDEDQESNGSDIDPPAQITHTSRKQFSRYDCKGESTEDDFSDALSHVSTECSIEKENYRHGCRESVDNSPFSETDPCLMETPLKLCLPMETPETADITMMSKSLRLRNRTTSSVLTAVENFSQWKQLKESSETNYGKKTSESKGFVESTGECGSFSAVVSKVPLARKQKGVAREPEWKSENQDQNRNSNASDTVTEAAKEARMLIPVDASLSHWLRPAPPPSFQEKFQFSVQRKTDGHAPKQDHSRSPTTPAIPSQAQTPLKWIERPRFPTRRADDRPILGAIVTDGGGVYVAEKHWDGKGIPNTTTKYKEDQQVNWHTTPFDTRLKRALANQEGFFQKKLFTGATAAGSDAHIESSNAEEKYSVIY